MPTGAYATRADNPRAPERVRLRLVAMPLPNAVDENKITHSGPTRPGAWCSTVPTLHSGTGQRWRRGYPSPGSKAIIRYAMYENTAFTPRPVHRRFVLTSSLCLLVGLGPCTVDLYLSAFPSIQADFDTTAAAVQLTLTATTLGFALGQLIVGQLSDTFGRRRPLLLATALHVAASIGVAAAPEIGWLLIFRVLQGMGAAGSGVVAVAMVRDLFHGSTFVRVLSRLALIGGLAPSSRRWWVLSWFNSSVGAGCSQ